MSWQQLYSRAFDMTLQKAKCNLSAATLNESHRALAYADSISTVSQSKAHLEKTFNKIGLNDSQCYFLFHYSPIDKTHKQKSVSNNLQFLYWDLHKTESYDKQKPRLHAMKCQYLTDRK